MSFYLFIAILCLKMSSVYKPLTGLKDLVSMCSFISLSDVSAYVCLLRAVVVVVAAVVVVVVVSVVVSSNK